MIISLAAGFESGKKPVALRLNCISYRGGKAPDDPLAGQRACRISGLDPDAGQLCAISRRKTEDDFGHDVLLPAHVSRSWQADLDTGPRQARVGQT